MNNEQETLDELSTKEFDVDREVINAGDIDEDGLDVEIDGDMTKRTSSEYGVYWSLEVSVITKEGKLPSVINFSGARLHRLLEENWEFLSDKRFNISGSGEDFSRHYVITDIRET